MTFGDAPRCALALERKTRPNEVSGARRRRRSRAYNWYRKPRLRGFPGEGTPRRALPRARRGAADMRGPLRALARYPDRPWSLRYVIEKTTQQSMPLGIQLAFGKGTSGISVSEMQRRIVEHVQATPLCSQMLFRGEAMAPAISGAPRFAAAAAAAPSAHNMLLVRALRYAEFAPPEYELAGLSDWFFPRRAFVGDVVAFEHPDPVDASQPPPVLVRRVAALEGHVLESTDPDVADIVVPPRHCWVVADNPGDDAGPERPADSRAFGPVPTAHVLGRVVYAVRSATDHGAVMNSEQGAAADAAVLAAELDVASLAAALAREAPA